MPIRAEPTRNGGVGAAAKQVAEHASQIARLELRLATLELKAKVMRLGAGLGLTLTAALLGFFVLALLVGAGTAAWTLILPVWAALLVMGGCVLLLAGALGAAGALLLKQGAPPVPKQAIDEAKRTTEVLRAE